MKERRAAIPRFENPPPQYDANNEGRFRMSVGQALQDAISAVPQPPEVHVTASRSGASATLSLTALDAGRRVVALEFNKREGAAAETGWVDTWDTSSGTIGADYQLVRTEAISIPAGLDSSAEWRMQYRDQDGAVRTRGGPIPLANLASEDKRARFSHHGFRPANATSATEYSASLNATGLTGGTGTDGDFLAPLPVTPGIVITAILFRGLKGNASNDCWVELIRQNADDTNDTLATATITSTTMETITASLASEETVSTTATYLLDVFLNWVAGSSPQFSWIEVQYTAPDYSKTF